MVQTSHEERSVLRVQQDPFAVGLFESEEAGRPNGDAVAALFVIRFFRGASVWRNKSCCRCGKRCLNKLATIESCAAHPVRAGSTAVPKVLYGWAGLHGASQSKEREFASCSQLGARHSVKTSRSPVPGPNRIPDPWGRVDRMSVYRETSIRGLL